jgi:Flp pilus assembly protein protease CpaA
MTEGVMAMVLSALGEVALAVFLVTAAAWDLKTRRVPNWLTLPAVGAVLVWRVVRFVISCRLGQCMPSEFTFLFAWVFILVVLWPLRVFAGGDCKVLMVLFGVYPTIEMLVLSLVISGLVIGIVVVWRYARSHQLRTLGGLMWTRLMGKRGLPTEAELAMGEPTAFLFSAAGLCMLILQIS